VDEGVDLKPEDEKLDFWSDWEVSAPLGYSSRVEA